MKYTVPARFDLKRALDLAKLVDAAYERLDLDNAWQPAWHLKNNFPISSVQIEKE